MGHEGSAEGWKIEIENVWNLAKLSWRKIYLFIKKKVSNGQFMTFQKPEDGGKF